MTYETAKFEAALSNGLRGNDVQEITLFDLDPRSHKICPVQYPRHHVTYAPAKFDVAHPMVKEKMHLQENTLFDLLNVAQYPRHHVTYAPAKFETAPSQG